MFIIFHEIEGILNIMKISAIFKCPYQIVKGICIKYFICEFGTD